MLNKEGLAIYSKYVYTSLFTLDFCN